VDNNTLGSVAAALVDPREADFNTTTVFFGAVGNAIGPANFHVTNFSYSLGQFGGGC
jgi:hypothetical protein